jgi:hypothetical protein
MADHLQPMFRHLDPLPVGPDLDRLLEELSRLAIDIDDLRPIAAGN